MVRMQIDLPEQWLFQTSLTVRVADINYGGHLGNDRVLALVHEARVRWLARLGLSEMDVGGAGLLMAEAAILFRSEAFLGETLDILLGRTELRRSGFDLVALLTRPADEREIARVRTGMVCFDYAARKTVRIPQALARHLGQAT